MTVATMSESSTWQFIIWQMKLWFCLLNDSAYYINNYISDCASYIRIIYVTTTKMNVIDFLPLKKLVLCKRYQSCRVIGELSLGRVVSYIILKNRRMSLSCFKPIVCGEINARLSNHSISRGESHRKIQRGSTIWPEEIEGSRAHSDNGSIWTKLQKYKNPWYVQGREGRLIWL